MTDLADLLDSAAGQHPAPTPDVVGADLARGRRALVRRRWVRTSAVGLGTAAAVAAAVVLPGALGGDTTPRQVGVVVPADAAGVALVPFDAGPTPKPISPGLIPDGWTVSGNEYALVISPPGNVTSPDDFRGKLVVYLDANTIPNESLPMKVSVEVGDRTGFAIRSDDTALQVWVPMEDGRALRAQAPPSLGWDEATLGRFLGQVTVGDQATAGVG